MKARRTVTRSGAHVRGGFPRWAWWTVLLATFTFAVPLTSPWWSKVLRSEIPGTSEEEGDVLPAGGSEAAPPTADAPGSTLRVVLHTRVADQTALGTIEREVPYVRGVISQIQTAVAELAVGTPEAQALLPAGTRVLDVAFTPGGTVYVDFSPELDGGRAVGPDEEKAIVQGIVTTITANFSAVRRVVLLVDGKSPRPLHLDLTRPLRPDDPVFAPDETPTPPESPPPSPAAAAPQPPSVVPKTSPSLPAPTPLKPSPSPSFH